jgi:hypothetical protein
MFTVRKKINIKIKMKRWRRYIPIFTSSNKYEIIFSAKRYIPTAKSKYTDEVPKFFRIEFRVMPPCSLMNVRILNFTM